VRGRRAAVGALGRPRVGGCMRAVMARGVACVEREGVVWRFAGGSHADEPMLGGRETQHKVEVTERGANLQASQDVLEGILQNAARRPEMT